jgi:hypothetical protein
MYPTLYYIKEKTITIVLAAATIPAAGAGSYDPTLPGRPESSAALAEPKQENHDATAAQTP